MKIRLINWGVVLICLFLNARAQFICNSLNGYNTKHLTSAVQWQLTTEDYCLTNLTSSCTFYISFCQAAPRCFNEYSACQNASAEANVTIIGGFSTTIFHENEVAGSGFYAKFPAGPSLNISNFTCTPGLIIQFRCNPQVKWLLPMTNASASAPAPIDVDIDSKCLITMTFDYDGACIKKEEPKSGTHGGAVFLIILFAGLLAYFVLGIGYNWCVQDKKGVDMVPNKEFWLGLPLYFLEGCRAILAICTCSSSASPATYSSV